MSDLSISHIVRMVFKKEIGIYYFNRITVCRKFCGLEK